MNPRHEIAGLIGSTFAPPEMLNTDREPISLHEIRWDIEDAKDAATAVRTAGLKRNGETFSLVRDSKNNPNTLIASLELQHDQLTLEQSHLPMDRGPRRGRPAPPLVPPCAAQPLVDAWAPTP
jgi:hypothetical protein